MSNQRTIGKILLDINDTLRAENDQSTNHLEEVLIQEIDNALIYYFTQWDILNEARPSTFELEQLGELARSPQELAFDILYSKYMEFYGINEPPEYRTPEDTDINKETNPEGYYRDRMGLLSQLPEETTEKDFRGESHNTSPEDQIVNNLVDQGLVPIDPVINDILKSWNK